MTTALAPTIRFQPIYRDYDVAEDGPIFDVEEDAQGWIDTMVVAGRAAAGDWEIESVESFPAGTTFVAECQVEARIDYVLRGSRVAGHLSKRHLDPGDSRVTRVYYFGLGSPGKVHWHATVRFNVITSDEGSEPRLVIDDVTKRLVSPEHLETVTITQPFLARGGSDPEMLLALIDEAADHFTALLSEPGAFEHYAEHASLPSEQKVE